jgi:hypothetical protein
VDKAGVKLVEAHSTEVVGAGKRTSATLSWSGIPALFTAFGFKRATKLGKSSWVVQKRLGQGTWGRRAPSSAFWLPLMDAPSNG